LIGGAGTRSRGREKAHHPARRRAEPDRPAFGLPLSHALPLRLRPLLEGGAPDAGGPARAIRRLPPPRRRPGRAHRRRPRRRLTCIGWAERKRKVEVPSFT